jgi:hypothetical protein
MPRATSAKKRSPRPKPEPPKVEISIERSVLVPSRSSDAPANETLGKENKIKLTRSGDGLVKATNVYKSSYSDDWSECDDSFVLKLDDLKEAVAALEAEAA